MHPKFRHSELNLTETGLHWAAGNKVSDINFVVSSLHPIISRGKLGGVREAIANQVLRLRSDYACFSRAETNSADKQHRICVAHKALLYFPRL